MSAPRPLLWLGAGLVLGLAVGAVVLAVTHKQTSERFASDWLALSSRLSDANSAARRAEESSGRASRELEEYRSLVAAGARERKNAIERIIGQASQGGSGASAIASGLEGDIALARSIADRVGKLEAESRRGSIKP